MQEEVSNKVKLITSKKKRFKVYLSLRKYNLND